MGGCSPCDFGLPPPPPPPSAARKQRGLVKHSDSADSASTRASSGMSQDEEESLGPVMCELLRKIDVDSSSTISQLELVTAIRKHPEVANLLLPGVSQERLVTDEAVFDTIDELFESMAGGKQRVTYREFVDHLLRRGAEVTKNAAELRRLYDLIDADGSGAVSKLELLKAVEGSPEVAGLVVPDLDCDRALGNEMVFDAVKSVFAAIAHGKKRFDFHDFEKHFRQVHRPEVNAKSFFSKIGRASKRVFIISPSFGRNLNLQQAGLIEGAGYEAVHWCWEGLPIPETFDFPVYDYLPKISKELDDFLPDVVIASSKGGAYLTALWAAGLWRGPSVMINAHPTCTKLPEGVPVVLCHGSNDELFKPPRSYLREMVNAGAENRCFLYYSGNSGQLPTGQLTRWGDRHAMESLLSHDCLPRLVDAALSPEGPETHFMRSWRDRLTPARLNAERCLGYVPEMLRKCWNSPGRRGCDLQKLFEVPPGSKEYQHVSTIFKAQPVEKPVYLLSPPEVWEQVRIVKLERIENGPALEGCTKPYFEAVERSVKDQGLDFEPGVHTAWVFHGAAEAAIESIICNPVAGFQPLASGTRGAALWGGGTYFARDAKYVADGGFCGQPSPVDGTRKMLMCLFTAGLPCLGDPQQKGVLPYRKKPHSYHCAVDSLSSPEIYIGQQSGAAHAAYLITFAPN